MRISSSLAILVLGLAGSMAAAQTAPADKETPAEKIRKILEQPIALDFKGQDLQDIVNHLKQKTGVDFVLDANVSGQFGPMVMIAPAGGFGGAFPGAPV